MMLLIESIYTNPLTHPTRNNPRKCGAHGTLQNMQGAFLDPSPQMQGSQTINNRIESSVGIIPANAGLTKIFFNAFHVGLLRTSNSFNLCMSNRIITLTFTNRLLLNRFSLGISIHLSPLLKKTSYCLVMGQLVR